MKESTKEHDHGELPHCRTCDRPVGKTALADRGRLGEPLIFCDPSCREDYMTRVDLLLDGDQDEEAA